MTNGVNALIRELDLDAIGKARAAIALNLARRLDATSTLVRARWRKLRPVCRKELERLLTAMVDPGRDAAAMEMIASIFRREDS